MNFDQIETFLTLVKLNNYSRVADALNITQPAVTARIKSLENELNCKLFLMEKYKQPVLTKEGKMFFDYASRIFEEFHHVKKNISISQIQKIEFGFIPNFSPDLVADLLLSLDTKNMYISVRKGSSHSLIELVKNSELSLAFVYDPVPDSNLVVEKLEQVKMQFLINKDHPLANEQEITRDLLINQTYINHHTKYTDLQVKIHKKLKNLNLIIVNTHDIGLLYKFVHNQFGFTILPELSLGNLYEKEICAKPFKHLDDITASLYAVYRKDVVHDTNLHKIVLSSIDLMKDHLRSKLHTSRESSNRIKTT